MRAQMTRGLTWLRFGGAFAIIATAAAAAVGCGSSGSSEPSSKEAGAFDASAPDGTMAPTEGGPSADDASAGDAANFGEGGIDGGTPCDPDASADIDCTGLCGPVRNACTGTVKMCGGCMPAPLGDGGVDGGTEARVCDLSTNTCVKPKVTCAELGAQCGTVRDSCGDFLDCPDTNPKGCAAGQECNPDTNTCEACETVTCGDLGYECGFAWLGCGPNTESNFTDCGGCPPGADGGAQVCNAVFHNCEPSCTPPSAAVICAAAQALSGVNCGFISNGCGGIVDCDNVPGFGCPNGESCGVRGIANHCDPQTTPDECVALGRMCGNITSSCTGLQIHCGDCAMGQVCNPNGVCGSPCAAKTCADYAQFTCGTFSDGCGSTISCGTCPGGLCDQTTNTCCPEKQCGVDYAGQCGTALPNGCGGNTDSCPCASGTCTADGGAAAAPASGVPGACCAPHAATYYTGQNQCGTNLPDGCGHTINAACATGLECVANATGSPGPAPASGVVGSCCTRTDSCNLASGTCGAIQDSCRTAGTTYSCNKCVSPTTCMANTCCTPAPACAGAGGEGAECNDSKQPVTAGCGSARACTCAGSRVCWCTDHVCGSVANDPTGACKTPLTCATGYAGLCGTGLSNGTGGTIATCGCPAGQTCSTTTPGATGTCHCNNGLGQAYTCANVPGGPGQAGGDACGTYDNGCGGTLTCNCAAGMACNTAPNPNVCCTPAVCPTPALGSACGSVTNGCTAVNCGCPGGTGNENFTCTASKCACIPDTCRGRTGAQPDRCGGTLQCGG
jgi:hypothetical protein